MLTKLAKTSGALALLLGMAACEEPVEERYDGPVEKAVAEMRADAELAASHQGADLASDGIVTVLATADIQSWPEELALYHDGKDPALYLVDRADDTRLVQVNESWWFDKLESASIDGGRLVIEGTFYTGIGPEGARSFPAKFDVSLDENGNWVSVFVEE